MYHRRQFGRFLALVEGIEPGSKGSMSERDKRIFQDEIAGLLRKYRRRTFRGPVALQLSLRTTVRNPPHLHTIAKNFLDLLGQPPTPMPGFRSGLLYGDDSQVKVLSVSASHGNENPKVFVRGAPLNAFLEDVTLAGDAEMDLRDRSEDLWGLDEDPIQRFAGSVEREREFRRYFGDEGYDAVLFMERYEAQNYLLRNSFALDQLHHLLGTRHPGARRFPDLYRSIAQGIEARAQASRVRITLPELPARSGQSDGYRIAVEQAVAEFRKQFSWILDPLLVPIALEVVVKPAPSFRRTNVNDLDNVARNFLIPAVVDDFRPPSDIGWVADVHREALTNSNAAKVWEERSHRLPRSTRIGITRYDVLELPRELSDRSPGYVILSIVADPGGFRGLFERIDDAIDKWANKVRDRDW